MTELCTHMWYVPVVADLCYRYGGSGTPTAEKGQVCGICSVLSYFNINEVFVECIQDSYDITLKGKNSIGTYNKIHEALIDNALMRRLHNITSL